MLKKIQSLKRMLENNKQANIMATEAKFIAIDKHLDNDTVGRLLIIQKRINEQKSRIERVLELVISEYASAIYHGKINPPKLNNTPSWECGFLTVENKFTHKTVEIDGEKYDFYQMPKFFGGEIVGKNALVQWCIRHNASLIKAKFIFRVY